MVAVDVFLDVSDLCNLSFVSQVHGDVFRPAANPMFFSALVGTGYQLCVVAFCVICFAILGDLYTE